MPVYKDDDNTGNRIFSIRYKDVYGNNKRAVTRLRTKVNFGRGYVFEIT
ncbi:hypothetical protein ACV56Z_06615 [Staphylococcus aureus]